MEPWKRYLVFCSRVLVVNFDIDFRRFNAARNLIDIYQQTHFNLD